MTNIILHRFPREYGGLKGDWKNKDKNRLAGCASAWFFTGFNIE
jgi:hypothetical protein